MFLDIPINVSFSGHERNHLFLNSMGTHFDDVSGISGLDSEADGRVFVTFDYNRDGWTDIAMVNSNFPRFNLFRNRIKDHAPQQKKSPNFVAVRFVGGNRDGEPSSQYSNRDGYGASVRMKTGEMVLLREHRCGDGFASQNSSTLLIGIGDNSSVDSLKVSWPNKKKPEQTLENVKSGTLVTVYENPADSSNGTPFVQEAYVVPKAGTNHAQIAPPQEPVDKLDFLSTLTHLPKENPPKLLVYITTFTTCEACKRSEPQLENLNKVFGKEKIALLGVPVLLSETQEQLEAYEQDHSLPYRYLKDYNQSHDNRVQSMIIENIGDFGTPSTFVTDLKGNLLFSTVGVPSVSDIRNLLEREKRKQSSEQSR